MRYGEFRAAWDRALRESKLLSSDLWARETLDLRSTDRNYEVVAELGGGRRAGPFRVTAKLWFEWDSLAAARTATTEEDMLATLFGTRADRLSTDPAYLRVDVRLRATAPHDSPMPMPSKRALGAWLLEATKRLELVEPLTPEETVRERGDERLEVLAWQGAPEAKVLFTPEGELLLHEVHVSAFQLVWPPRILDDPDPEQDPEVDDQLRELFARVRAALVAWTEALDHLGGRFG